MLPQTECDAFQTILAAGELRNQAAQLVNKAEVLEGAARTQLQLTTIDLNAQTLVPGTVLCVAHGGGADKQIARVPFTSITGGVRLVAAGETVEALQYEPAVLIQMQQFYVGALLVPKGGRMAMYNELGRMGMEEPLALALAKMLVLAVGFNPEMTYGVVQQLAKTAASNAEIEFDSPMLMKLG